MIFTPQHLRAFANLSHDRNPLHLEEHYAARTPFGRNVVYGMGLILSGLGQWACDQPFALRSIAGHFRKPIYLYEEYAVRIVETGNFVELQFMSGSSSRANAMFEWEHFRPSGEEALTAENAFHPRQIAADREYSEFDAVVAEQELKYCPNLPVLRELRDRIRLSSQQMPLCQLSALLWASYFVGMEIPGRQALFSDFEFDFALPAIERVEIGLTDITFATNPCFGQISVSGCGDGIKRFKLTAFQRPRSVTYPIESVREEVREGQALAGKVAVVSGAARGFGSVLAKSFALHGADVVVNYRSDEESAQRTASEIRRYGRNVMLAPGDISQESICSNIAKQITEKYCTMDILVNNASPPIGARPFLEWTPHEFMVFVEHSIRMCVQSCYQFIPIMKSGGWIINVSSIYSKAPGPQFTHYVTAKMAIEGLSKALAQEHKHLNFIMVYPPRMLTDQTNLVYEIRPPVSASKVAGQLLNAVFSLPSNANYHELELG